MTAAGGRQPFDGYDAARRAAAVFERSPRGVIAVAGRDAVSFLHGILTNDIQHLEAGRACYAAYLTPQGRMLSDMDVLRRQDDVLLDVEPEVREALLRRFDQSLFTEDVTIADRSGDLRSIGVYGPEAAGALRAAVAGASGSGAFTPPETNRHVSVTHEESEVIVLGTDRLRVSGFHLFGPPRAIAALGAALVTAGAARLTPLAAESLRIEAGVPRFGADMTDDTIPLEAGIEERAISMTKGCYVGQEVIVRVLHRGQGRVARRLVGLRASGALALSPAARLESGGRDVGFVTSSIVSPRFGPIALGYVHRDFTQPGTRLTPAGAGSTEVTVALLPFEDDELA